MHRWDLSPTRFRPAPRPPSRPEVCGGGSGSRLTAAGCRSLPSSGASAYGSPEESAVSNGSGSSSRAVGTHPPEAGRSGVHRSRRQPTVPEGQNPVKGVARQHRCQFLTAAGAQRGAAVQGERHVAANSAVIARRSRRGTPSSQSAFIPPERLPRPRRPRPCRRRPKWTCRW